MTIADEESDEVCELCGRRMVIKYGPHGRFLACPGFPECRNTKPYFEKIGVACPKCGKDIVMKKTKKAENIMAVSIIRSVISWYGRSLRERSVPVVASCCWKRQQTGLHGRTVRLCENKPTEEK